MKTTLTILSFCMAAVMLSSMSQKSSADITQCVQIKCSKTMYMVSMTAPTAADLEKKIKQTYPNCSFSYVDKSKCKK